MGGKEDARSAVKWMAKELKSQFNNVIPATLCAGYCILSLFCRIWTGLSYVNENLLQKRHFIFYIPRCALPRPRSTKDRFQGQQPSKIFTWVIIHAETLLLHAYSLPRTRIARTINNYMSGFERILWSTSDGGILVALKIYFILN